MNLYYDLHIHSALSACGDNDMTPNNIVNMAMLKGLDIIAVTDHNSVGNLPAVQTLCNEKGILLLPGMELETAEEVHLLCYFEDVQTAYSFETELAPLRLHIQNRADIFGMQLLMDAADNIIKEEKMLLSVSTKLTIDKAVDLVRSFGGAAVPAHVDKTSYSIFSNLGSIPNEYDITTVELSARPEAYDFARENQLKDKYNVIQNSDAHYLWDIMEKVNYLSNCEKSTKKIINFLKKFTINS